MLVREQIVNALPFGQIKSVGERKMRILFLLFCDTELIGQPASQPAGVFAFLGDLLVRLACCQLVCLFSSWCVFVVQVMFHLWLVIENRWNMDEYNLFAGVVQGVGGGCPPLRPEHIPNAAEWNAIIQLSFINKRENRKSIFNKVFIR